jgi:hypothetical protein
MHEAHRRPAESSAALWAPLARFIAVEDRIGRWAEQRRARAVGRSRSKGDARV